MARESAKILTGIWGNPDIRALTLEQQGLYLQIWTHPGLSYAGVLDWNPARIAQLSSGSSAARVAELAGEIASRLLFVIDHETGELLVRPWLRHDGILKQPKMAAAMANAYAGAASNKLRGVIIHELRRLQVEEPTRAAWKADSVKAILKHPAVDPKVGSGALMPAVTGAETPDHTPALSSVGSGAALPTATGERSGETPGVPLLPPTTTTTTTSTKNLVQPPVEPRIESPSSIDSKPYSKAFDEWWLSYPRRQGKGDAWKAWEALRRSKTLPELATLVVATASYASTQTDPQFTKMPAGWLRGHHWTDEAPDAPAAPTAWSGKEMFGGPSA